MIQDTLAEPEWADRLGDADRRTDPLFTVNLTPYGLCLQARDNRVAPEVCQSVSGRVRGSPKRVMTLVVKQVMAVIWSPTVVMTWRP